MAIASTLGLLSMTTDIVLDLAGTAIAAVNFHGAPYRSPSTKAGQMAPNRLESAHMALFEPVDTVGHPPGKLYHKRDARVPLKCWKSKLNFSPPSAGHKLAA